MLLGHWAEFPEQDKLAMLAEILHDAERVVHLVDELLDANRLDSGQLQLRLQATSLPELVHRVVGRLQRAYPALSPEVQLPGLPEVAVDPYKVEQVLANVLDNACRHGGARSVRIYAESTAGRVSVTISDRGPGIAPSDLPHVADKFWKGGDGQPGGLGLGLWVSRQVVEAHGGALSVSSAPGQGTQVSFTLPVHDGEPADKLQGP